MKGFHGFFYIEDNDKIGREKARKIVKQAWKLGIPAVRIPITKLWYDAVQCDLSKGDDIADLLTLNTSIDLGTELWKLNKLQS